MIQARQAAHELTHELRQRLGPNLRSVVLHGSVARGEAVPGVSDVNVLVLLEVADADALRGAAPLAVRWVAAGNAPPLLLTRDEWRRATDVFAIEVADMQQAREMLHGDDPVAGVRVDASHLRLQTERELRGKLLQLREGTLLAAESPADLGRLLLSALPSFTTYMRATLRLEDRPVPDETPEVIRQSARLIGAAAEPMLTVWEARATTRPLDLDIGDPLVSGYYHMAEQLADHVDALP